MKVIILQGLPASGKSTYAKKLVAKGGWTRINKDDLRAMMHGGKWSKKNELEVLTARDQMIETAIQAGQSVIVDDTNFNPQHIHDIKTIVANRAQVEIKRLEVDVEVCIKRDALRENGVGAKVIERMREMELKMYPVEQYEPDLSLIKEEYGGTIICDIDGTLAHMHGRNPYDYDKVSEDTCDEHVLIMLEALSEFHEIIFLSGRENVCEEDTRKWIDKYVSFPYELYMREAGDHRNDAIIKWEIFKKLIENKLVLYTIDDRDRVVRMWREHGVKCFQANPGNF